MSVAVPCLDFKYNLLPTVLHNMLFSLFFSPFRLKCLAGQDIFFFVLHNSKLADLFTVPISPSQFLKMGSCQQLFQFTDGIK